MNLLFTDLDDTLLNRSATISPAMRGALSQMLSRGHRLILSSGRTVSSVLTLMRKIGLTFPGILIIANNGAQVYDCDSGKNLLSLRLSLDDTLSLWDMAEQAGLYLQTYGKAETGEEPCASADEYIIAPREGEELSYYRVRNPLPYRLARAERLLELLGEPPYKCLAIDLANRRKLESFRRTVELALGERVGTMFSHYAYLELIPKEASKGNAVRFLCDYLRVPLSRAYAAGDEENDISMLKAAGVGVAMANAGENVKKAADVITKRDNEHDGLLEILIRYFGCSQEAQAE